MAGQWGTSSAKMTDPLLAATLAVRWVVEMVDWSAADWAILWAGLTACQLAATLVTPMAGKLACSWDCYSVASTVDRSARSWVGG